MGTYKATFDHIHCDDIIETRLPRSVFQRLAATTGKALLMNTGTLCLNLKCNTVWGNLIHLTLTSFVVAIEPVGVECTFMLSTCGYILGQQWIFISPGTYNIVPLY